MIETDDEPVARRRKIRPLEQEEQKRHKRVLMENVGRLGMWPLNAPGMPPPGPDFLRVAQAMGDDTNYVKGTKTKKAVYEPGDTLKKLYKRALREPGFTLDVKVREGVYDTVTFVPGHIWGQHAESWAASLADHTVQPTPVDGPHPAEVFILGKMPWKDETAYGRNLIGATGEILTDLVAKFRLKKAQKWYVSNLCKFAPPNEARDLDRKSVV